MADDEGETAPVGRAEATTESCASCRARLDTDDWHPVVTLTDGDGELELYAFCDETCRAAWEDGQH